MEETTAPDASPARRATTHARRSDVLDVVDDLYRSRLEPVLRAPHTYPADAADTALRARCLWVVARFRRALCDAAAQQRIDLGEILALALGHAQPSLRAAGGRLVLAAVDCAAALIETTVERLRASMALYDGGLTTRAGRLAGPSPQQQQSPDAPSGGLVVVVLDEAGAPTLRPVPPPPSSSGLAGVLGAVKAACGPTAERAVETARLAATPEGVLRCVQCAALCVEAAAHPHPDADVADAADVALMAALGTQIGLHLAPRAWRVFEQHDDAGTTTPTAADAARYASTRLRAAVLGVLTSASRANV
eukprot:CAMPEP_0185711440 /NCGR_PEP_ID=MMETSP1164-20130828/32875_1 /TAXON_ID=1104430 /ORGANISM="Chrysoreinhardia sp, Strain CCMP2950" /LENGTH=305 /DNA_ID=CAMNT_0028378983 /DNA_START=80 /DNA_END=994 /DNA_ORIENTATION=+